MRKLTAFCLFFVMVYLAFLRMDDPQEWTDIAWFLYIYIGGLLKWTWLT